MSDYKLRRPCVCGNEFGYIVTNNGQDTVWCSACKRWQYNAPKTETGREPRTVQTTHKAIKPKQRYRIIEAANGRCVLCGKKDVELHIDHAISVKDGHAAQLPDEILSSDDNLLAMCAECNLGKGNHVLPLRILIAALIARTKKTENEDEEEVPF